LTRLARGFSGYPCTFCTRFLLLPKITHELLQPSATNVPNRDKNKKSFGSRQNAGFPFK